MSRVRDRWLDDNHPLDFISVDYVQRATNDALRGAYAQIQWLWEQLEPADSILATCVERRLGALRRIPWDVRKKDNLTDAEDALADAQLRTLQDFAHAIENLEEGIAALAQASFRAYRRLQLLETPSGALRLNTTDNWNWCRDGYRGPWRWNPAATFGLTRGEPLPVPEECIITRLCPRPIDQPAMMLCLDRRNAKAQWLVFNGRYGVPPLFAIMPNGIDERTRSQYIEFARQCISNAAGVLPAGSDVKTVTPGTTGPDTFSRLIELTNQEMVLRATGGLMTMLTAPGAGTTTETGSAHQDAFDDLAAAEAEEIAALLHEELFAPVLDQWHPGQPHLVEFVMQRPDSDNASGTIANVAALAGAGYRTATDQLCELTGLELSDSGAPMAGAQPGSGVGGVGGNGGGVGGGGLTPLAAALHSLRRRFAPTMLYPPARAVFERAINSKLFMTSAAGVVARPELSTAAGCGVSSTRAAGVVARPELSTAAGCGAASTTAARQSRTAAAAAPGASVPLTPEELGLIRQLAEAPLDSAALEQEAREAYESLAAATGREQQRACNSEEWEETASPVTLEVISLSKSNTEEQAANCNQYGHDADCPGPKAESARKAQSTPEGQTIGDVYDSLTSLPQGRAPSAEYHRMHRLSERTAREAARQISAMPDAEKQLKGVNLHEARHAISEMYMRHALNRHPELSREDFMLIPDITENWDKLTIAPPNKREAPRLVYEKRYGNETYTVVEQIKSSRLGDISFFKTEYVSE